MKMNKWISICCLLWLTVCCTGCEEAGQGTALPDVPESPVVILYESDVHCAVDGYARLAALKSEQEAVTPYVSTVSCGDFVQGDLMGSVSLGEYIVDIMNRVGYDVVALGNHEFDFGMEQLFALAKRLEATTVCANLRDLRTGKPVFPPYHLISYGRAEVAFIGLLTTETSTSTSPLTYRDEAGNLIYDFMKEEFYTHAQRCIDEARAEGADYVVVLSHLGDLPSEEHPTSLSLVAHTTGIDVVLDGHSHSTIPDTTLYDKEGKPVLLSSTGIKFQHIGLLTIATDGVLSTRLVPTEEIAADADVQAFVEEIKETVTEGGQRVVGQNTVPLIATDEAGNRLVRLREMPLGNLCADAFRHTLNTDVAMVNGGGIRADLPTGEVTFNDLMALFPFGNTLCTATLTGQQLADALEVSVRLLPQENGSFMQVSGLRFEVDCSRPTPVVLDEEGLFSHLSPDLPRRVSHIYIRNRESGEYLPLEPERRYTLASFDYQLKELGSEGIFSHTVLKEDDQGLDVEILSTYIEQSLGGILGAPYDKTEGRLTIHPTGK